MLRTALHRRGPLAAPTVRVSGYRAIESLSMHHHWDVIAPNGATVDTVRVRSVAEYMALRLEAGEALIRPRACLGCRIEVL